MSEETVILITYVVALSAAIAIINNGWKAWREEGNFWALLFSIFLGAPIGGGIVGMIVGKILSGLT